MEQVDTQDTKIVTDFTKSLGVSIPSKWIKFASDAIQMLDAEGIASAQMILKQDLPKVAEADKPAYVLMAFDAIRKAYDKEEHTTASDEFFAEYLTYENGIKSVTSRFAADWNKRSEAIIAQDKQETAQMKQETAQMKQEVSQKSKLAENGLLKLYETNPSDPRVVSMAKELKDFFKETNYPYTQKTAQIFAQLGIK